MNALEYDDAKNNNNTKGEERSKRKGEGPLLHAATRLLPSDRPVLISSIIDDNRSRIESGCA